jgi:uroporphyrin-III C-methyltransferase / precorrin-2 dehydrogenase / sirohydrochlorin ferrochelatase
MQQLPIFVNLEGRAVILIGAGPAADAKRRLVERAGGNCVGEDHSSARLAFVAVEDAQEAEQAAERLKARAILVNVVDRPALCDFTTPAIIDRAPVLVAIGTGGASAGLAKALRQRLERLLPHSLGDLARALFDSRSALHARFGDPADRRRALDAALDEAGPLDPLSPVSNNAVAAWLSGSQNTCADRVVPIQLSSGDPEDLTLWQARLLGQADTIFFEDGVSGAVLVRARADAVRVNGSVPDPAPSGLTLHLKLHKGPQA